MQGHELAALRVEITYIVLGALFVFFGFAALAVAAIRERREVLILVWFGIWSGIYGVNLLTKSQSTVEALPRALARANPFVTNALGFLLLVAALLAWSELTIGKVRTFVQVMLVPSAAVAVAGIGLLAVNGSMDRLNSLNRLLAAIAAVVLATVVSVPKLSARYMTYKSPSLTVGALLFALDALYRNVTGVLQLPSTLSRFWDDLVFAAFLFAFASVAARKVFANERRLLSIDKELQIARQLQASILPGSVPEIEHLQIVASYRPMAAVGGDFYEFLPIDRQRAGFLIADVSGHGIPAALIASMIKIGVQSTVSCAANPGEVLGRLNHLLSGQLRGVLLSAAYLWVDTEARVALYSAAGHPPLLRGRESGLERIESNGLLMGVFADSAYPVRQVDLRVGDRFLLCTDGVLEAENAAGDAFGECRLPQVIRENEGRSAADLSAQVLSEIGRWRPARTEQQDDITLLVIDVV